MLNELFGNCPQVKVIDYLLAHPFDDYTKQQIAVGSGISRSTLDKFIKDLIDLGFLRVNQNVRYEINKKLNLVKLLDRVQNELAVIEMNKQAETFDEDVIEYSDEEIDNMFETDVPDIDLDEAEREIEEEVLINKNEYDLLKRFKTSNEHSFKVFYPPMKPKNRAGVLGFTQKNNKPFLMVF